ncbi:MAG: T9SS type A sorting domain-containing protein [Bacteroidetes bacterium]|nr:MAG: T9SS type A sorting domain-containing protein [Bacteroidota bacterium]
MKKLSLIFLCLLGLNVALFAQWTQQTSGTAARLSSVFFPAKDTGYAVGRDYPTGAHGGTIFKTTNGGNNWTMLTINGYDSITLQSIYFTSVDIGYAVERDKIYKTTNGGNSWTITNIGCTNQQYSVFFSLSDTGYALCENGNIYKTINSGNNWALFSNVPTLSYCIYFTSPDTGYIGGNAIYKTTDRGINWTFQMSASVNTFFSFSFTSIDTGYAVGTNGSIFKTTNGGTNWTQQISGTIGNLMSVFFVAPDTGYIVGQGGKILKTNDGGNNWQPQVSGTSNNLESVFFTDANTGYAVGPNGIILKTTNGGVVGVSENDKEESIKIYPNPSGGIFNVQMANSAMSPLIEVYNLFGEKVNKIPVLDQLMSSRKSFVFDLSFESDGMYFVKASDQNGNSVVEKIIIQK